MDCNKSHCSYVYEIMSVTRKDPEKSCNFFFGFEIRTYPQIFGNVIFVITLFYNISRKHNRLKEKGLAPAMALFLPAVYPIFLSLIFTSFFFSCMTSVSWTCVKSGGHQNMQSTMNEKA